MKSKEEEENGRGLLSRDVRFRKRKNGEKNDGRVDERRA